MADPISIAGLVIQIGVILKHLYEYGKELENARDAIRKLCCELLALKGVLEEIQAHHANVAGNAIVFDSLANAKELLADLLLRLEDPTSKRRRIKQALAWPLNQDYVTRMLSNLERVKSLILLLLIGEVHTSIKDLSSLRKDVESITEALQSSRIKQAESELLMTRQRLLQFIAPASPFYIHSKACAIWKAYPCGSWFLEGTLSSWLRRSDCNNRILFLQGKSGSGKSTLISRATEFIRTDNQQYAVAFMYCTYNDAASREISNILGAWIAQLWHKNPEALDRLQKYASRQDQPPYDLLIDVLIHLAEVDGPVVLTLDAINESQNPASLTAAIVALLDGTSKIRVLISSTLDPDVLFAANTRPFSRVYMSSKVVQPDIANYLRSRVAKHDVLSCMPKDDIVGAILSKADGMFRALLHLPETLNDTYVSSLQRIHGSSSDFVREALLWLSLAHRPMTLKELVDAVVIEYQDTSIDVHSRIQPASRLIEQGQGFILWDSHTDLATLAHGSIRTFLQSDFISSSPAHFFAINNAFDMAKMISKCLTYLMMDVFGIGICSRKELYRLLEEYPLLDYASKMWTVHAHEFAASYGNLPDHVMALIKTLFWTHRSNPAGGQFTFWINCLIPDAGLEVIQAAEPLYFAALFGLADVVSSMIQDNMIDLHNPKAPWYIDRKSGRADFTALQVACWRGHEAVVVLLLASGADPNATNHAGLSCLSCAKLRGFVAIERRLTEAGARHESSSLPQIINPHTSVESGCDAVSVSLVRRVLAKTLGIDVCKITSETELHALGMDSIMELTIVAELRKTHTFDMHPVALFAHQTIGDLEAALEPFAQS